MTQRISKLEQAVLPSKDTPKPDQIDEPHFAIYDESFAAILGPTPSITLAIEKDWPFAHEAGIYPPSQDAVFITSNRLVDGDSSKIKISKISRDGTTNTWSAEELPEGLVEMANGGINHGASDDLLFCAQGSKTSRGGLVSMQTKPPYTTRTILNNYHGRAFNSPNDVVIHSDGSIWFTDPIYGYEQGFKSAPQLPNQVYRFDPGTGDVRVVADGFGRPNGLCFSPDEQTLYVTDTDWIHGDGTTDDTRASTM